MKTAPGPADRATDAAALLLVLLGIGLFAYARNALTGIGSGTYEMPMGISAVAVTDLHVAQSRLGLWIVGIGVLVGVFAALRHRLR